MAILEKNQAPTQTVDVTSWPLSEDYEGIFPKGARDKSALFCPDQQPYSFLIPRRRYLFKRSFQRYPEQYWVEIVAYRLGCLMGVPVPPAFAAYTGIDQNDGALIE